MAISQPGRDLLRVVCKSFLAYGVITLLHGEQLWATSSYSILDLGNVDDYPALNELGQVAASSHFGTYDHPFRTAPNSSITAASDLGTLGGARAHGNGINDLGQVVGESDVSGSGTYHAFRTGGTGSLTAAHDIVDVNTFNSTAMGINNAGQVVGDAGYSGNGHTSEAFRTAPSGKITPESFLGTLGGSQSAATAINDSGVATGYSNLAGDITHHALRISATGVIDAASDLGALGSKGSVGLGINASGQVVGVTYMPDDYAQHAFRTKATGGITTDSDLGTLGGGRVSRALAINDAGQTVGFSFLADDSTRVAFFADSNDTTMIDLNSLLPQDSGWFLTNATSINNLGQIAGLGFFNGSYRGFLLTPVPEPTALGVIAIGSMALLRRTRRSRSQVSHCDRRRLQ